MVEAPPYLTRSALAVKLGVSESTIDRWRKRRINPIPHLKIGHVEFDWEAVRRWRAKFQRG